ncbi:transient receptor potential cation channel subfamily m member 3 [Plakobranchus ocellatus]|uniref:Transient receptor potential cation channel subfamily m member 3 n=1 Tax=Plakobranchus ocellatus TaxID=259542 RepID=A0AAV4CEY0_9GAST|nr:transient receptor potential cation channel subfamily m member 3 [Plakobranchus ocellatus]
MVTVTIRTWCLGDENDGVASVLRNLIRYPSQGWLNFLRSNSKDEWKDFPKKGILQSINETIIHLLKDDSFSFYMEPKYIVEKEEPCIEWKGDQIVIKPLLERMFSSSNMNKVQTTAGSKTQQSQNPNSSCAKQFLKMKDSFDFEHPERDLFIFSVLFNRRKLVNLFLRKGSFHVGMSLFGASLLKALSRRARIDEEDHLSTDMLQHALSMEQVSKALLDECYASSRQDAHLLLTREIHQLGGMSCLLHADRQHLMDFAEHSACQTRLSSIWKGSLSLHTSELKVFLTILCPFLVWFIKFDMARTWASKNDIEQISEKRRGPQIQHQQPVSEGYQRRNLQRNNSQRPRLRHVSIFKCNNRDSINPFMALFKFYKTPLTRFMANVISYVFFLGLFSYFTLTNLKAVSASNSPSTVEVVVWFWFFTILMEEFRQVMVKGQHSLKYKLLNWGNNFWNLFDLLTHVFMIASITIRLLIHESKFVAARYAYSLTLTVYFLRVLQFFFAEKNMGPKVIMIRKMLKDLMYFLLIFMVVLVSFGVAYHINMFPNSPVSMLILRDVLYYPYFQIYGELSLDDLTKGGDGSCTDNETLWLENPNRRCPEDNGMVPVLLALYLLLTNILLINLLIAMFSYTFQVIQENSTKVWRYNRISLVNEYCDRPTLVPPVIVLNHLWRIMRYFLAEKGQVAKRHNPFSVRLSHDINLRLTQLEKTAMNMYLSTSRDRVEMFLDNRVANTAERLDSMMDDLLRIKESAVYQGKDTEQAGGGDGVDSRVTLHKLGDGTSVNKSEKDLAELKQQFSELKAQSVSNTTKLGEISNLLQSLLAQKQQ